MTIMSAVSDTPVAALEKKYRTENSYRTFKEDLAEAVITRLAPIQERFANIMADETALHKVLAQGAQKAQKRAAATVKIVRERVGLLPPY